MDKQILSNFHHGGSTALCALVRKDSLFAINLGDSIGALIRENEIVKISELHSCGVEEERRMIIERGGVVIHHNNVHRVQGSLALSRSFGDKSYKPFISCVPDVKEYKLSKKDQLIVLGTDGFWDAMKLEDVREFVVEAREKEGECSLVQNLSKNLIDQAFARMRDLRKDNMTVIVVDVQEILRYSMMPAASCKKGRGLLEFGWTKKDSSDTINTETTQSTVGNTESSSNLLLDLSPKCMRGEDCFRQSDSSISASVDNFSKQNSAYLFICWFVSSLFFFSSKSFPISQIKSFFPPHFCILFHIITYRSKSFGRGYSFPYHGNELTLLLLLLLEYLSLLAFLLFDVYLVV
eukprot:TRINITY_DN5831_c0_g1_i5.p1 TRINITY_DN5831_c0_g1~~TRINITY_DN5831_c0_g1_i5.p1  ORF type:complete len:350 (+),score=38.02 TRINITY_DN5831_c0_g1_i5:703-1752(+)